MASNPYDLICDRIHRDGLPAGALTFGDCVRLAEAGGVSVGTAVIAEAMAARRLSAAEVIDGLLAAFARNLEALKVGRTCGRSPLMGTVGADLASDGAPGLTGHGLLDKAVAYTLASQVGNHQIGLQPCAGTGDACVYTGLMQAMDEEIADRQTIGRAAAVMLKLGTLFREGKSTTGCNMEGLGAGAAASAAAFTEIGNGAAAAMERAVVLALSPTIAVPCTPRVMVPGLCATHIGGAVLIGWLASHLACHTSLPVPVPVDVIMALAAAVHPISARAVVPEVVRHMAPFFQSRLEVEALVDQAERSREQAANQSLLIEARQRIEALARHARSIVDPFAAVVTGGSSQAVGSPVNTARLAHALARGRVCKVRIELAPELFARRGINVPGILAAAAYGSAGQDPGEAGDVFARLLADGVAVTLMRADQAGLQKIAIQADQAHAMVAACNRGGGRIHLIDADPSLAEAFRMASVLQIEVVD